MKEKYNQINLHVIKTAGEKSILYNVANNMVVRIPTEFATRLLMYQKGHNDHELENVLDREFGNKEEFIPLHTNWFDTGVLDMLVINVTNKCNLRCSYCYTHYGKFNAINANNKNIDSNTINSLFQFIKKNRIVEINKVMFFGGEPLLAYKEIDEICNEFLKLFSIGEIKKIPKYGLVTNLTQCNEDIINVIDRNQIELTASIDGPLKIHNKQRSNSYDVVKKNYELLKNNIKAIEATYTMNHVNEGISVYQLKKILSNEFSIDTSCIDVVPVSGCKELEVNSVLNEKMLNDEEANMEDGFIFSAFDEKKQSDLFCNAGCNRICVSIEGDIYPCQMYVNYQNAKLCNLNKFDEEKYVSTLEKLPSRIRNENKCKDCWARKFCKKCPAQSMAMHSESYLSDEKCKERLNRYEKLMCQCVFGESEN